MENTQERIVKAARRYLEARGYEVVDQAEWDSAPVLVLDDDGVVAFAQVAYGMHEMPADTFDRDSFEAFAGGYLAEHDIADCQVRADRIDVMVVSGDRALLRHAVNRSGVPREAA